MTRQPLCNRFCAFGNNTMSVATRHSRGNSRQGYILLVTLVLLGLAATAAVMISRAAIERIQVVTEAEAELQCRWGKLSCQAFLLPHAEVMLHSAEIRLKQPVASLPCHLTLGDQVIDLLVSDESAKANAGVLIQRQGHDQAALTVRRLSLGNPDIAGTVHLRSELGGPPRCFGDLFDAASPQMLMKRDLGPPPAELLTCWGDGLLNIHRASKAAMDEILVGTLSTSQIDRLIALQKTEPNISLASALKELQLTEKDEAKADQLLSNASNCYSLWIDCRTARRSFWSLAIADLSNSLAAKVICFQW